MEKLRTKTQYQFANDDAGVSRTATQKILDRL